MVTSDSSISWDQCPRIDPCSCWYCGRSCSRCSSCSRTFNSITQEAIITFTSETSRSQCGLINNNIFTGGISMAIISFTFTFIGIFTEKGGYWWNDAEIKWWAWGETDWTAAIFANIKASVIIWVERSLASCKLWAQAVFGAKVRISHATFGSRVAFAIIIENLKIMAGD